MEICHTAFLLKMACSSEMRQNGEMVTKLQGIFFDPKVRHGGSPRSNSVEPSGHLPKWAQCSTQRQFTLKFCRTLSPFTIMPTPL
jgi:hypothetical protein